MAEHTERVSEGERVGGGVAAAAVVVVVEGKGKREEGREQRLGESEVRGRGKTVGEKGRCFC